MEKLPFGSDVAGGAMSLLEVREQMPKPNSSWAFSIQSVQSFRCCQFLSVCCCLVVPDSLQPFADIEDVCLVGGTCELDGFVKIVQDVLRINAFRPEKPQFVTPLGIALSCLGAV